MLQFCQISAKVGDMDKEGFLIDQLNSEYIGDDGAVVEGSIYSMDAFHEDVHFKREWMTSAQIGKKAMLINLSDAIAMNAIPLYALVSISLPIYMNEKEITELIQSLEATAGEYACKIIGGDTVGGDKLHLSITIISKSDDPLLRKGLQVNDLLAYTGHLGESKRDLDQLMQGKKIAEDSRFFEPTLRQEFISQSREYLRVGMDISDGLYCDTNKLLDSNHLGFESLIDISDEMGMSGEEYEMLIGFAPEVLDQVMKIAKETDTALTVYARVVKSERRFICASHHF